MIFIKKSKIKKKIFFFNKFLFAYFLSTLSIAILLFVFVFTSSYFKKKTFQVLDHFSRAGRFEYIYIFDIGWKAIESNFYSIKKIDLEINFKDILVVENYRKKAIDNGTLGNSENIPEVKGILIFNNKKSKATLRLKGERKLHFEEKSKSSYKIELKKNNYILGLNKFSLQKPRARNYIHEWLFHEMAGDLGLIKIKYEFIKLHINGASQGLYVLEESFGKELIERNSRRNGPIFAFDDNMVNYSTNFKVNQNDPFFEIYNKKYWNREENISLLKVASQKLRDFINGKRSIEETFDLDKFAKFFAIMDATYTYHALSPGTLRLYYNPINGIFEPIPFDGQRALPNYHKYNTTFDNDLLIDKKKGWWTEKFFFNNKDLNKNFYNKYRDNLIKISSAEYLNNLLKLREKKIKKINSFIYSDYFFYANDYDFGPGLYYFSEKDLYHRVKILRQRTDSLNKNVQVIRGEKNDYLIRVFFKNCFKCKPYSTLTNIVLKDISCVSADKTKSKNFIIEKQLNIYKNTLIKIDNNIDKLNCTHFRFYDKVQKEIFINEISHLNSNHKSSNFTDIDIKLNNKYFKEINNEFYLISDKIIINENLFIPKNKKVIIKPGQNISLINNAFILSHSPWIAEGSEKEKIFISGNFDNYGGGLIITGPKEKSFFSHVNFSYLNGLKKSNLEKSNNGHIILGSINFHQTNIDLKNIVLNQINSEDAINIINSEFIIENIEFIENSTDSIDLDFSNGIINNALFKNIGNDAIDFSGSIVSIKNINFDNINDKLVSVGENSKVNIDNLKAKKSYVGIASKDGSTVNGKNIFMEDVKLPFASYNKKFEYENAKMFLTNINVKDFHEKWIIDDDSKIFLENSPVGRVSKNIIQVIYQKNLELLNKSIN